MSAKFKTLRHIETVRNFINAAIRELTFRAEKHDQSKLESPEVEIFDIYTEKLRGMTYGSEEYKACCRGMGPALEHHYKANRHHPEYFGKEGVLKMNLIDILEMIIDWKAAGMRHNDGDIFKSIEINQKRFGFSNELAQILFNTALWMNETPVYQKANES